MNLASAIQAVNKYGVMLVFPIQNRREPLSLWYHFFPRSKMKWEWNDDGDDRVAKLWHLREKLSSSNKVVYCKWFRDRATVISRELYPALIRMTFSELDEKTNVSDTISKEAREILEILDDNSPLSTKALKELSGLRGQLNESDYQRRLKELWRKLLIVGVGEVDDGAFPSLAIASSKLYFEDEWKQARAMSSEEAIRLCHRILGKENAFFKFLIKSC